MGLHPFHAKLYFTQIRRINKKFLIFLHLSETQKLVYFCKTTHVALIENYCGAQHRWVKNLSNDIFKKTDEIV